MKKILSAFFGAGILLGFCWLTFNNLRLKQELASERAAGPRSMQEAGIEKTTRILSEGGCSNFCVMVIGQKGEDGEGGLVRSNTITLGVGVKMQDLTKPWPVSTHRL